MSVLNAVDPTPEQIQAFLKDTPAGQPVFMLNLLKFKTKATYTHRASDKDPAYYEVSGAQAYMRYAKAFGRMVESLNHKNAQAVFGGQMGAWLIGQGEGEWDACAIVSYPDAQTMFETVSSPDYRKIHYHRKAGLDGQLLIALDDSGVF